MNALTLLLALAAGVALGVFYFGSLWWTVQRVGTLRHRELALLAGFVVRTAVTIGGMVLVTGCQWQRVAAWLVGFLLARTVLIRRLRPDTSAATSS